MARVKENVPYVFLHPAWRGAWCWDKVLAVMKAWGREAYAVDCPGMERASTRSSRSRSRTTHLVIEFIEERGLDRVVLVGNSSGGLISQLVAQEIPERVSHITWYMAFVLRGGESILDACPPEFAAHLDQMM